MARNPGEQPRIVLSGRLGGEEREHPDELSLDAAFQRLQAAGVQDPATPEEYAKVWEGMVAPGTILTFDTNDGRTLKVQLLDVNKKTFRIEEEQGKE